MATVEAPRPKLGRNGDRMTLEEFRAIPDEGIERELLGGVVRVVDEEEQATRRSKKHCGSMSRVDYVLDHWLETDPDATGCVMSGEIGVELPIVNVAVGSDIAYFSGAILPPNFPEDTEDPFVELAPTLAVEILSPSDKQGGVLRRIGEYPDAGVEAVWVVEPVRKTVTSYRDDAPPRMMAGDDPLTEPGVLPGFDVPVSKLFRFVVRK